MVKDGASDLDICDNNPTVFAKYFKGIDRMRNLVCKPRDKNVAPTIEIYWGDSGTGKTRKAIEDNPDAYIVTKPNGNNTLWYDGYTGQTTLIYDEFYGWASYDHILRICDRYPLKVQIKGGFVEMRATKIIFTSNKPYTDWWPNVNDKSAFERRIKEFGKITHFAKMEEADLGFA